jgi:hypothetical protein
MHFCHLTEKRRNYIFNSGSSYTFVKMKAIFICWNVHNAFYFWLLEATCINMREIWRATIPNLVQVTLTMVLVTMTLTVSVIMLNITKKVKIEGHNKKLQLAWTLNRCKILEISFTLFCTKNHRWQHTANNGHWNQHIQGRVKTCTPLEQQSIWYLWSDVTLTICLATDIRTRTTGYKNSLKMYFPILHFS